MMKRMLLVALIGFTLLLGACGRGQADNGAADEGQTAPVHTSSEQTPPSDTEQTGTEAASGEPAEEAEELPVDKLYHMNKVYNIVPNDEGTEKKVVLLTFDDGPKDRDMIEGLIDTLDKHNAKAIFFVNGYRVKQNPELLQLIHDRGQIIGNHSWDHINLKKESNDSIKKQIEDVQQIVEDTIGERPLFFRPPFGSGNDEVRRVVKDNGMLYMTWSNGSLDWDSKNKNKPEEVIKNVLEQLHPGSNILMHELPWTVEALDELLTKLEEKEYTFVDPRSIDFDKSEV